VSTTSSTDPASITEPVGRALDTLIVGAAASFALSIVAVLATIFAAEGPIHAIAHLSLPALMIGVVVVRGSHVLRRHPTPGDGTWDRARAVDRWSTRLAQVLGLAVPLAWLAGGIAILARHGTELHGHAPTLGLWLPVSAALWILATFAWVDACRDRVAAGLEEADRKFRAYWRDIGRSA
jgi:hypothetical protein